MKILLSNNYYRASSIYSGHSCMLNVSNKNVYKAQTFALFIIALHRVQEDGAVEVLRRMDYLIKRVFSERVWPTFPHYRASQSRGPPLSNQASLACMRDKTTRLSSHASNREHQTHSNFRIHLNFVFI